MERKPRWPLALALFLLAGCGTLPDGRGWGSGATLAVDNQRLREAAAGAARDPGTWLPAAAALAVALGGADRRLSDWARAETPLFGSNKEASHRSDELRSATNVGMFGTALLTPSGGDGREWITNKAGGIGVEALAVVTTIGATNFLKETVRRRQPDAGRDEEGHESFTSNHATEPFARAALIRRNTDHLGLPPAVEGAVDGAFYLMAAGSAWARVEAGLHYPSDQLAGAAIGNFLALFVHDALLGPAVGGPSAGVTPDSMVVLRFPL